MNLARRDALKSLSLGAGSVVLSPLLASLQAQAKGTYKRPKRVVFVLFDNGFYDQGAQPVGVVAVDAHEPEREHQHRERDAARDPSAQTRDHEGKLSLPSPESRLSARWWRFAPRAEEAAAALRAE